MQQDLTAAMLEDPAIADLVERRVYWKRRPQGTGLPVLVMHQVHGRALYTLDGRMQLSPYVIQFDCRAARYAEALGLARAVIARLDRLRSTPFQGAFLRALRDDAEPDDGPLTAPTAEDFLVSLDAQVWHFSA